MSIAGGERSANRGSCAQNCRLPYNLTDGNGTTYLPKAICYRLKLDLSDQIPNLIEAGICSFKIEGRLKDIVYVK
jgi:putative protease